MRVHSKIFLTPILKGMLHVLTVSGDDEICTGFMTYFCRLIKDLNAQFLITIAKLKIRLML